jgi:hypothetical protein
VDLHAHARTEQSPERIFGFLADIRNHWQLSRRFAELEMVDHDDAGGRVRIRGPLGLSRVARTRVVSAEEPRRLLGRAEIGHGTLGSVRWDIDRAESGSVVTLSATVDRATVGDRVLLAAGGAWWLRRILREAVQRVGEVA